ncbi:MAG: universal stress protein [Thermoplasmata archaeon]|nr:universal stress protein [Thermoplasmata archaeon]
MTASVLGKILVCFDGTAHARQAAHLALEIGGRFHSELTIATVFEQVHGKSEPLLQSLVPISEDGKTLARMIDEARDRAAALGITKVHVVALEGDVADALTSYLERHPQDLVVVGSRGLSRGRRLLVGSVSMDLVQRIPAPVLVVRPAKERTRRSDSAVPTSTDPKPKSDPA